MRHQHLAAEYDTDLLELDLTKVPDLRSKSLAITFAHALHLAAAELLEVDIRELILSAQEIENGTSWKIQLYDSEAGGSGHVLELAERHFELLEAMRRVLRRDSVHNATCSNACIQCLLTTGSQRAYESGWLNRKSLLAFLDSHHDQPAQGLTREAVYQPSA